MFCALAPCLGTSSPPAVRLPPLECDKCSPPSYVPAGAVRCSRRAKVACVRPHAAPGFRVVARWGGQIAAWADLEDGVEATLDSFHRSKTDFFPWS